MRLLKEMNSIDATDTLVDIKAKIEDVSYLLQSLKNYMILTDKNYGTDCSDLLRVSIAKAESLKKVFDELQTTFDRAI
jgi:hypothetical protein